MIEPALLTRLPPGLDRHGFQCHFHAIGDGGIRLALDSIQAARVGQRG